MPVAFSDVVVPGRKGERRALVITPTEHRRVGRDRLRELRETEDESPIEVGLIDRVTSAARPYQIVIFRGANDDETASWGFDASLDVDEGRELARRLVLSHLPTHRCLLAHGAWMMVHTDFGVLEADLLRRASEEILEEKRFSHPAGAMRAAIRDVDVWLLRHLNFYFSLGFERVVQSVLPDKLPLIEMRKDNMQQLADALRATGANVAGAVRDLPFKAAP